MFNASNTSTEENSPFPPPPISPLVEFWIDTISDGLSLGCSLFVLYCILFDRALRRALNNHIIIILLLLGLIYELTTIPWHLHRLCYGKPWIETPIFYLFAYLCDYALTVAQVVLFAWATVERHILIFHDRWVSTQKKRFFAHYLPILAILIYCLVYFLIITFAPICKNSFDLFLAINVFIPRVFNKSVLGTWDLLVHQLLPVLVIVIFSVALLVRVIWQKRARNQAILWRRHRKMTVQLLSISVLYLLLGSPITIIIFASQYGLPASVTTIPIAYAVVFRRYVIIIFPFVCCGSLSELQKNVKRLIFWKRQNRIAIERTLELGRMTDGRTVKVNTVVQ